ncbi:hypothetical protein ACQ4PT_065816 [Festuca glaucescens]
MEPPPPPGIRVRLWMDDPPAYVTDPLLGPNLFSVEVSHQGSFFGFGANLEYLNDSISVFDNLLIDEWSNAKVDEILSYLECRRDEKVHVYWMYPGKSLYEGLMPLVTEAHCIEMRRATALDKSLAIFVDHSNWVRIIRSDIILTRPAFAVHEPVAARQARTYGGQGSVAAQSTSIVVAHEPGEECDQSHVADSDSSSGSDWCDSDYDAQDGDDDLFLDNVDIDVNDNNERIPIDDNEDEAALDDTDLNLQQGERDLLLAKMNAFNPEVDMDRPILKRGLQFANIEEARQALNAYIVRERVKIRRIKNDRTRLHAVCDVGCPWYMRVGFDLRRSGGFVITQYEGNHRCEKVYEMRVLTAAFLAKQFIQEFRDNQKMDLTTFATKVQREYHILPDRWKLGRARKAALLEIHGNEEAQFAQLREYGEELKRSNPGSTFFLSTNKVPVPGTDENLFPQTPDERLDPSVRHDHMVYMMRQEAAAHAPFDVVQEPLPESQFVVAARESMPQGAARMTTATTEGRARMADSARGRGRAGRSAETARGRGRAGISAETARGRGRGRTLGPAKSTRNVGKKRAADASTSGTAGQNDDAATGNIQRTGYRTGPGSVYYMLFGDDRQPSSVLDLNDQCNEDMNIGEEPLDFNNFLSL